MDPDRAAQLDAVAALAEPTRRRLYEHVVRQAAPVSRDEAAAALGLARTTAAFHLDRLAEGGLLDVAFERRTGRSGPGAGRPTKLYRRSACQVAVSVPERRYELAGRLLAAALAEADRTGEPPRDVLHRTAHAAGGRLAEASDGRGLDAVLRVLERHGFVPQAGDGTDGAVTLTNCPFHVLAAEQTELVCGMNLRLLDGLLEALAPTGCTAELAPSPGRCCVRLSKNNSG